MKGMKRRDFLRLSILFLASCAAPEEKPPGSTPSFAPATIYPGIATCHPVPLVVPTRPAEIPSLYEVDDVGLHVTARPVDLDPGSYRLQVSGLVEKPLSFSLDELRCLPKVTRKITLTCPGFFSDSATWSGTPLRPILEMAGVQKGARTFNLIGADGYQGYVTLENGMRAENFLAYQLENGPVPILHGFPVRAALPGQYGSYWTKWLVEIKVA
jgi:DMSO/TMAO reductase YedYZ molybdopterin-dependent catalytic subunit